MSFIIDMKWNCFFNCAFNGAATYWYLASSKFRFQWSKRRAYIYGLVEVSCAQPLCLWLVRWLYAEQEEKNSNSAKKN
jgi:hypothetical protein